MKIEREKERRLERKIGRKGGWLREAMGSICRVRIDSCVEIDVYARKYRKEKLMKKTRKNNFPRDFEGIERLDRGDIACAKAYR